MFFLRLLAGFALRVHPLRVSLLVATGLVGAPGLVFAQTISVNGVTAPASVTAPAGSTISVVVTGSTNRFDWVTFATTGSSNATYVSWKYLNGSQTAPASAINTATVTFSLPFGTTAHEVRLLANNGYTRLATSGPITPAWPTNATVSIDGAIAPDRLYPAPAASTLVHVANASGSPTDWIGLYDVPSGQLRLWKYLNNAGTAPAQGLTAATIPWILPDTHGTYEFRLWANGSSTTLLATSPQLVIEYPITVNDVPRPNIAYVGPTSGAAVTVQGPGGLFDWVGLYTPGAADTAFLDWQYLNGQQTLPTQAQTSATLRFDEAPGPGRYEFRFFANNAYARLATSDPWVSTCVTEATPRMVEATAGTSSATLAVAAAPGCTWMASSPSGFVTVTSGTTGAGSREVSLALAAHTGTTGRIGVVDLGGRQVPVVQESAGLAARCAVVSPASVSIGPSGGVSTVEVTADPACAWASVSASPFLHVTRGLSGKGSRSVSVRVMPNLSADSRTGTVVVAGTAIAVTQEALPKVSAPQLTLAPGTYQSTQVLTVTAPSGAVLRYTTSGAVPTTADPQWPSSLLVDRSVTVTVRAWQDGFSPSDPVVGTYVLQVPPISLTPVSGTYPAPVTVAMTTASDASIRYTLDGSIPHEGAALYGGPFTLTTSATVTARAFKAGWSPSAPVASTISAVTRPTLTRLVPTTGGAGTILTLTGEGFGLAGTGTVTVNGVPAPVVEWTPTRILARVPAGAASGAVTVTVQGQASNGLALTVTPDTEGPTIAPEYSSAASATGWHRGPVTVRFTCTDATLVVSCPGPVTFAQVGVNPPFTVSAADSLGNQTALTLQVRIDPTAPTLSLTAPNEGLVTTVASVVVAAQVADAVSGVASASCNGQAAVVGTGAVTCTVALRPGINTILVAAVDGAGHSASHAVRVTRQRTDDEPASILTVLPANRTLTVGETFALSAAMDVPVTPLWTSSDPAVVSVEADGSGIVTAVAPGAATITAWYQTSSAQATVTVRASALEPGEVRWRGPAPSPSAIATWVLPAHRVDDDGPDLFTVEQHTATGPYTIRSLTADGRLLSTETTSWRPLFGDAYGGLLLRSEQGNRLARFASSGTQRPWTYDATSVLFPEGVTLTYESMAQGPDGTIYVIQWLFNELVDSSDPDSGLQTETELVGLDGQTGQPVFRVPLRASTNTVRPQGCRTSTGLRNSDVRTAPQYGSVAIGTDGAAYLELTESHWTWQPVCATWMEPLFVDPQPGADPGGPGTLIERHGQQPGLGFRAYSSQTELLRVSSAGAVTRTPLFAASHTHPDYDGSGALQLPAWEDSSPGPVIPDGLGGMLATWYHWSGSTYAQTSTQTTRIARVVEGTITTNRVQQAPIVMVGERTAYAQDNQIVRALDLTTLTEKWSALGEPVMALGGDGVAVRQPQTGLVTALTASGETGASFTTAMATPTSAYRLGEWLGQDPSSGSVTSVAGIAVAPGYWQASGSAQPTFGHALTKRTPAEAAIAALRFYNPASIKGNTEFAGSLCRLPTGRYYAGVPNEGIYSDRVIPLGCTSGLRRGDYHTHGTHGNDGFSGPDIQKANLDISTDGYIQYFVATPCGHIDSYVGPPVPDTPLSRPNPANYVRLTETTETPIRCVP